MHAVLTATMDEELKESADMDLSTYDALLHLFEAGSSGLRMNELADTIVVSHSGLTSRVDRLAEKDLVERVPDPDDRRATRIRLTPTGEKAFRAAASVHLASIKHHFLDHIDDEQARAIFTVMEDITARHQ